MRGGSTLLTSAPSAGSDFRFAAALCAIAVALVLLAFEETAISMVRIWQSSETFSHGFVVAPVSLWLMWRNRAELSRAAVRPCWPGLVVLAGACFLWMLGSLADANVVKHFALVAMIQSVVLVVLGVQLTRAMAFPLLFLYFAVPFGEAFVPKLMDWTADFTVFALKLTGIPVYREGNNFVIPSGNWSVVEACSGIRYLIASMMAGTLYAYLMYRSQRRRLMFVVAAVIVPLLANWLRAYGIVMIGHLSANELATGVDHLIYGWLFFGIVLFAMFWVGARFREDHETPAAMPASKSAPGDRGPVVRAALAAVALAVVWTPLASALLATEPDHARALQPVAAAAGWRQVDPVPGPEWRPHFAGHRAELRQTFERAGQRVSVAVYYFAEQEQGRELINSANVLITTTDPLWRETARGQTELGSGAGRTPARTANLSGQGRRIKVAWWYWVDGRATASDSVAKLLLAWSRLRLRNDDSAAVFLFTEQPSQGDAGDLLQQFAGDMGSAITTSLVSTRDAAR